MSCTSISNIKTKMVTPKQNFVAFSENLNFTTSIFVFGLSETLATTLCHTPKDVHKAWHKKVEI